MSIEALAAQRTPAYRSTTERARELRAAYKARGWTARKISVRSDYFSMGSEIRVVIRDPDIPIATVKALAEDHEKISRCEVTGEILGGGNRYVSVSYSHEALATMTDRYLDAVTDAANKTNAGESGLIQVNGTDYSIGQPAAGRFSVWGPDHFIQDAYTVEGAAEVVALSIAKSA